MLKNLKQVKVIQQEHDEALMEMETKVDTLTSGMFMGVTYDNKLLNYPQLIKKALEQYDLAKIIELSTTLSDELVNEAIKLNDPNVLLAGLMSLDG